jgi:triosephosphate isomerase
LTEAKRPFFGANWKMHKGPTEARSFAEEFARQYEPDPGRSVVFFPPSVTVPAFREATGDRPDLELGIQDVHEEEAGAHTGSVSAPMAADAGCAWGLAGHSERRREFGDTDDQVARKVARLLEAEVRPMLCVGETLEEREAGRLEEVLVRQVTSVLESLEDDDRRRLVYAYEPVWAIGTGRTARPEDAAGAHGIVREAVAGSTDEATARDAVVVYGGSVKPHNVDELMEAPGVDGALVGSASLDPRDFAAICRAG